MRRQSIDTSAIEDAIARYHQTVAVGRLIPFWTRRWDKSGEFQKWVDQGALPLLTVRQAQTLYRASSGRMAREFASNQEEEIKEGIDFLLYDPIKLEGRFYECTADEGSYKLKGAGKEFMSYLLCVKDPMLFGVWNASTERGLGRLGLFPSSLRKGHIGARYVEILDVLGRLRQVTGLADFRIIDEFLYTVSKG